MGLTIGRPKTESATRASRRAWIESDERSLISAAISVGGVAGVWAKAFPRKSALKFAPGTVGAPPQFETPLVKFTVLLFGEVIRSNWAVIRQSRMTPVPR